MYEGKSVGHRYFCFCDKVPALGGQVASEDKQCQSKMSTQQLKTCLEMCRRTCGIFSLGSSHTHGRPSFST